jgi:hypothetical protein
MRTPAVVMAMLLAACGDEPAQEPAALGEVCGEDGPFQVLPLDPDIVLAGLPVEFGDRVLVPTGRLVRDGQGSYIAEDHHWSVGRCGESPVSLDHYLEIVDVSDRWPDLLLAHRPYEDDVVVVDPLGVDPPHVVFAGLGRWTAWSDLGLLSVEPTGESTGAVRLFPYPDDPLGEAVPGTVIYEPVVASSSGYVRERDFVAGGDAMWTITADHALVRVDLADGEASLVAAPVRLFMMSRDRRLIVWQHLTATGGDSNYPTGQVFLHDTATGYDVFLGDGHVATFLGPAIAGDASDGLLQVNLGAGRFGPNRVYRLPSLDPVDLPESRSIRAVLADGRWLLGAPKDGSNEVLDPDDGSLTPLLAGEILTIHADALDVLQVDPCCRESGADPRDVGALYRVPLDGSPPQRLADEFTRAGAALPDGRRVGAIDIDDDELTQLLLLDPGTRTMRSIDDRVFAYGVESSSAFGEDLVVYSVDDGERSGVWLARVD